MMARLVFRPVTMNDAIFLFMLRNDPLTVKNSRSDQPVSWEQHLNWLSLQHRPFWIVERDGEDVGQVGYEPLLPGVVEIGLTVAPDYRGQGIGNQIVAQVPGTDDTVLAQVKRDNTPMLRIFVHNGYQVIQRHPNRLVLLCKVKHPLQAVA